MNDDAELLCRYANEGSESAFAELVRRHVDLVYGAALRRTGGDPHRAADVAQQVFTTLARDARKLSHHALLPAWLHTATRNAALNLMISEKRRQTRETEALTLDAATAGGGANPDWDRLRPLLDAAIDELPEADRTAVILRFLERRPFAEIAAALQVSEDAARMRTDRTLDKLRPALARRGITSTGSALGAIMLGQPLAAAPAGLAAQFATQALAVTGAGTLATFMTTKIIAAAVVGLLLAFGTGTYVGRQFEAATPPSPALNQPDQSRLVASLRQDNLALKAEADRLNADVAELNETNAQLKTLLRPAAPPRNPTLGLARWEVERTILTNLRQIDAARKQYKLEHGQAPGSIDPLVGRRNYIKAVRTVGGEDYSGLSMEEGTVMTVTTPDGVTVTFDPTGATTTQPDVPPEVAHAEQLGQKVQPTIRKAAAAYQAAHNGSAPPNSDALLAYFATPEEAADFAEFVEAQKTANAKAP
jgi:RNA polymerase sigma factor (sigma-70 family)